METTLYRFEYELKSKGLMPGEISTHVQNLSNIIHGQIANLITQYMQEIRQIAIERDALDFLQQLSLEDFGDYLSIATTSGQLDFEKPGYPNLPWLLQNPKISKDGYGYKVIPIGKKTPHTKTISVKKVPSIRDMNKFDSSQDITSSIASNFNRESTLESITINKQETSPPVAFRTASEKQNPNISWKIPSKKKKMSDVVIDMNRKIKNEIYSIINNSIIQYLKEIF